MLLVDLGAVRATRTALQGVIAQRQIRIDGLMRRLQLSDWKLQASAVALQASAVALQASSAAREAHLPSSHLPRTVNVKLAPA